MSNMVNFCHSFKFRNSQARKTEGLVASDSSVAVSEESHSIILEPLQFTATVTRNISKPTQAFPNIDICLGLGTIKVRISKNYF